MNVNHRKTDDELLASSQHNIFMCWPTPCLQRESNASSRSTQDMVEECIKPI